MLRRGRWVAHVKYPTLCAEGGYIEPSRADDDVEDSWNEQEVDRKNELVVEITKLLPLNSDERSNVDDFSR